MSTNDKNNLIPLQNYEGDMDAHKKTFEPIITREYQEAMKVLIDQNNRHKQHIKLLADSNTKFEEVNTKLASDNAKLTDENNKLSKISHEIINDSKKLKVHSQNVDSINKYLESTVDDISEKNRDWLKKIDQLLIMLAQNMKTMVKQVWHTYLNT